MPNSKLRQQIVDFFRAVGDAMIVIVHWVLLAAPIGVFALSLGVGLRAGIGAAGVLAQIGEGERAGESDQFQHGGSPISGAARPAA